MKKIILFISTFMLFLGFVKADTYSEWQEEKIEDPNVLVEEEIRYRYYMEKETGEFVKAGYNPRYQFEKLNIGYYSMQYEDWTDNDCEKSDDYLYNVQKFYPYKEVETSKVLIIDNISSDLKINKVIIKYDNNEYELTTKNCTECDLDNHLVKKNGQIFYDLPDYFNTSKIKVLIDTDDSNVTFRIGLYHQIYPFSLTGEYYGNSCQKEYEVDYTWLNDSSIYTNIKYSETELEDNPFIIKYHWKNRCRKRYKYTYHYNLNRTYLNYNNEEYFSSLDDLVISNKDKLIKDEPGKTYYRYLPIKKEIITDNIQVANSTKLQDVSDNLPDLQAASVNENDNNYIEMTPIAENIDNLVEEVSFEQKIKNTKTSINSDYKVKKSGFQYFVFILGIILFILLGISSLLRKNVD